MLLVKLINDRIGYFFKKKKKLVIFSDKRYCQAEALFVLNFIFFASQEFSLFELKNFPNERKKAFWLICFILFWGDQLVSKILEEFVPFFKNLFFPSYIYLL